VPAPRTLAVSGSRPRPRVVAGLVPAFHGGHQAAPPCRGRPRAGLSRRAPGRAPVSWPPQGGHPRLRASQNVVDGRHEAGHDGVAGTWPA